MTRSCHLTYKYIYQQFYYKRFWLLLCHLILYYEVGFKKHFKFIRSGLEFTFISRKKSEVKFVISLFCSVLQKQYKTWMYFYSLWSVRVYYFSSHLPFKQELCNRQPNFFHTCNCLYFRYGSSIPPEYILVIWSALKSNQKLIRNIQNTLQICRKNLLLILVAKIICVAMTIYTSLLLSSHRLEINAPDKLIRNTFIERTFIG